MANFRTSFAYIIALVSLIIAISMVIQRRPVEVVGLSPPLPSPTPLPKAGPFPGAARLAQCQTVSQPRYFFYAPIPAAGDGLTISGTVYASDLTPLSGALVEIWPGEVRYRNHPYPPILFGGRLHTDEAGHYGFKTTRFRWSEVSYLHYRVTYRDYCPLLMSLHFLREPPSKPAEHIVAKVQVVGPILQGPVNIVMPVPSQP